MDIRALRYFQTVAECGSYSRGSQMLHISQPAVSRTIKHLETHLGATLFVRHGHGVSLTNAGRALLGRSQVILRLVEQTKQEIKAGGLGPTGVVTLAIPPAAGYYLAPELFRRVTEQLPLVKLKVVGGFSGYINEWLIRRDVDLACVHDPVPRRGFDASLLLGEKVFIVGKTGTFPTAGPTVDMADLPNMPLILPSRPNASRRLVDSWAVPSGAWLEPTAEVDDHTIMRSMVKHGVGFCLLTWGAFADDLESGSVEARELAPTSRWRLALVSRQSSPESEAVGKVADLIRSTAGQLVAQGKWPGASNVTNE